MHGPTASNPPGSTPQEAEALLEPSRRTVTVEISPAPDPVITVALDFHDGNGSRQVLAAPASQPVPDTYKFGFATSTGLFTDVHLIRNLTVHPAAALPRLNLVKQVSQEPPLPLPLTPGARVPHEYVASNSGNVPLSGVNVTDDRVTDISCPRTTLGVGETMTCTGTYADADGTAGCVTNTATAQGKDGETPVMSPPDDAPSRSRAWNRVTARAVTSRTPATTARAATGPPLPRRTPQAPRRTPGRVTAAPTTAAVTSTTPVRGRRCWPEVPGWPVPVCC
ncbi:hypothetical protein [Streptomyces sp. NPDC048462]|uniref:DUF7507 domain-containing protein n=1 Tax=Streptomyces sp. NPDC048462 TaxID=3365555 RepID=UPI00371FFC3E